MEASPFCKGHVDTLTILTELTKARIADTPNQEKVARKLPTPTVMQTQRREPHTGLAHFEVHLRLNF